MQKIFFERIILVLLVGVIISCNQQEHIPRANKGHLTKDSFYFYRDTLNFHHVIIDKNVINCIDSIVGKYPLKENYYWTLTIEKKNKNIINFYLNRTYCERFMLYLDNSDQPYKCSLINNYEIFIYDEDNVMPINYDLPYIKIVNPQKMEEFYKKSRYTWSFYRRKGQITFMGQSN